MTRKNGHSDGLFRLDAGELQRRMNKLQLSKTALADKAGLKRSTVYRVMRREGVRISTAQLICDTLEIEDLEEVLLDDTKSVQSRLSEPLSREWQVEAFTSPWITASNALQFRVCRMSHRLLPERRGRGKCYDLQHLSTTLQEQLCEHVLRHPKVCERIGRHRHLAENLSVAPGDQPGIWWVIDRLIPGGTLEEQLGEGAYPPKALPRLMCEIADGLHALHERDIAFRELAPRRVLVEERTGRAVLTDFELAKLLNGAPTVSAKWPDDPYRAPEVETGRAGVQADLYSWARILVHAAVGHLPDIGEHVDALTGADLPREVRKLACDCLSTAPSDRPQGIGALLRIVRRWASET